MGIRQFVNIPLDEKNFVREFTYDINYKALTVKDNNIYTDIYSVDENKGIRRNFGRRFNIGGSFGADKISKKVNNIYSKDYINSGIGKYAAGINISKFDVNNKGGAGEFISKMPEMGGINRGFPGGRKFLNRSFPNSNRSFPSGRSNFPRRSNNFLKGGNNFLRGGNSFPRGGGGFPKGGPGGFKGGPGSPKGLSNYKGGFDFPGGPNNPSNLGGLYNYYPYFFIPPTTPNNSKPLLKDLPLFNNEEFNTFKRYNYF